MIKLIIFDLGKVILDFSLSMIAEGLARHSNNYLYANPQNIVDYMLGQGNDITVSYETGRIKSDDVYNYIKKTFSLDLTFHQFKQVWSYIFAENEGVADLIDKLKKDFKLYLLSNTNELHFEFIRQKFPVVHKFDTWILSYEVGVMKPDPEIFRIALLKAGVGADETIFIDDIRGHVLGAQGMGINAVEFKSVEQITSYIEEKVYEQSAK
ncbi:MAG: HAD family phosphatase [Nitrospirota bacterium]